MAAMRLQPPPAKGETGMTQVDVFNSTLQKTERWLRDIREALGWDSDQRAYMALRAVLHTLRDRLPVIEAVHLGAQLPMLIRGFYYEGWNPLNNPLKLTREEFLFCVATHFRNDPDLDLIPIVRTVFDVILGHTDAGQMIKIAGLLPRDFADLWPAFSAR
jgi:uncharacterized protein (DUF2267 family)